MSRSKGRRYTEEEKLKAYRMWCDGVSYREISKEIGCSVDTVKHSWAKKWKDMRHTVAGQIRKDAVKLAQNQVAIEQYQLDHLLELRIQDALISQKIIECLDTKDDRMLIQFLKEKRENISLSAKLEGVEPPQKNLNITVHTDMQSLKERLKEYEGVFDE